MYQPSLGDVVLNNDMNMVVIAININEGIGGSYSCCYDRSYRLCLVDELKTNMSQIEFENLGYVIQVRGTKFPDIQKVEDVAPFVITKVLSYEIRQKQAKTITIYE